MKRKLIALCLLPILAFGHWALDFDELVAAAGSAWSPLSLSPVAWWKMNDPVGTQAVDYAGGYTAIKSGTITPTPTNGLFGSAFFIGGGNATSAGMTPGDADAFTFASGTNDLPFSIALWAKYAGNGYSPFAAKSDFGNNLREYIFYNSEEQGYRPTLVLMKTGSFANRIGRKMSTALNIDEWHHICVTYSGSKTASGILIYTNGVIAGAADYNAGTYTGMTNTATKLAIGNDWNNGNAANSFNGTMQHVLIFNRALTPEEITRIYEWREE